MYKSNIGNNYMKFEFSATYPFMEKMCSEVENFTINHNLDNNKFTLLLCIREAVTNSIKHGSKNDSTKNIIVTINYKKNNINVIVKDEGIGFDWKNHISKPSENLIPGGRGLVIMDKYCSQKKYNNKGNQVELMINIEKS